MEQNLKVVIFCGGQGLRIREVADDVPKPLVCVGGEPVLVHLMRYYAHYGYRDFVLCVGYRSELIRRYFSSQDGARWSTQSNQLILRSAPPAPWRITFVDSGLEASIGQRLLAAREVLADDQVFLANYADGLTDLHLPSYVDRAIATGATATFLAVRPNLTYHFVESEPGGRVVRMGPIASQLWINGGYFVLRRQLFDVLRDGEDLVEEPFRRLLQAGQLRVHQHHGFYASLDTLKDKVMLDSLVATGQAPWQMWRSLEVEARA
jgi:glucose-1-phosphate cytidylyltransferase